MRSSKSRSRNKNNRRPSGNIVNRVFDSSGPEGKVRGTPQQIIDKYNQLARDAQLAGDRVAVENFQQHAEHYSRMLAEAMREAAKEAEARREQQEAAANQARERRERERAQQDQKDAHAADPAEAPQPYTPAQPALIPVEGEGEGSLVDTPEAKPARKPRSRKPRAQKPSDQAQAAPQPETAAQPVPEKAQDPAAE